jgi:hypothetical protein
VRDEGVSGIPAGDLLVVRDGVRSFRIMTIDIPAAKDGKLAIG